MLQPYYIRIYGDWARKTFELLDNKKEFPFFFINLSKRQMQIVIDTLVVTDGFSKGNQYYLTTTSKHDAEIIQLMCILNGFNCSIKTGETKSGFKNGKLQYRLSFIDSNFSKSYFNQERILYNDSVYCVTTNLGNIITRLDGKVCLTGNSSVSNRNETNITTRFIKGLQTVNSNIIRGNYSGFIQFHFYSSITHIIYRICFRFLIVTLHLYLILLY